MRCTACAAENDDIHRFCGHCGLPLAGSPQTRALPAPRPGSVGELKQVTVFFADIVDSTAMVAELDAEAAMERLQRILVRMRSGVERYGGTVVVTLGDALMALFGVPRALEGHAVLACQAALALQHGFAGEPGMPALRIGLHSGEIASDGPAMTPGSPLNAHGLTIHIASRVVALAEPGSILLTDSSRKLVQTHCETHPVGVHRLRGVPAPVAIHRLVSLRAAGTGHEIRGVRLSAFRGRDAEMARLQRAWLAAQAGEARVIGVSGQPGLGKSRLCFEFAQWCAARGAVVHEARAQFYGHTTPLQPVRELLGQLFLGTATAAEPEAAHRLIAARLAETGVEDPTDAGFIAELLGGTRPVAPPGSINPTARLIRLRDIIRARLVHNGAPATVILIEDLHWLDDASARLIGLLAAAIAGTRTLLLLNYRPEYQMAAGRIAVSEEITLGEMEPAEIRALVRDLVGAGPNLAELHGRIAEHSGGNPFFAEELVRSLVEGGTLVGSHAAYAMRPGKEMAATVLALPPTLQAVLGARIDALPLKDRSLLQLCATIGKEMALDLLQDLAALPTQSLEAALGRLCAAGLLQFQLAADGPRYTFRHALIQDVAYATQFKARRTQLHASIADAMVVRYADRLDEMTGLLAHHCEAAGRLRDAVLYAARAASWVGTASPSLAIRHWRKVRALIAELPRDAETDPLRMLASAQIAYMGWRDGLRIEDARPLIQEAIHWSREVDPRMVPLLMVVEARIAATSGGNVDVYAGKVREAMELLPPGVRDGRAAILNGALCQALAWGGQLRPALAAADAAMADFDRILPADHEFYGFNMGHWILSMRASLLERLGRLDESEACCDEVERDYGASTDPTVTLISDVVRLKIACARGDVEDASSQLERVTRTAKRFGSAFLRVHALHGQALFAMLQDDVAAAVGYWVEALDLVRQANVATHLEAELLAGLAESHRLAGMLEAAMAAAEAAITLARTRSMRVAECRASLTLAACWHDTGMSREEDVAALFDQAQALLEECGLCVEAAALRRAQDRLPRGSARWDLAH